MDVFFWNTVYSRRTKTLCISHSQTASTCWWDHQHRFQTGRVIVTIITIASVVVTFSITHIALWARAYNSRSQPAHQREPCGTSLDQDLGTIWVDHHGPKHFVAGDHAGPRCKTIWDPRSNECSRLRNLLSITSWDPYDIQWHLWTTWTLISDSSWPRL